MAIELSISQGGVGGSHWSRISRILSPIFMCGMKNGIFGTSDWLNGSVLVRTVFFPGPLMFRWGMSGVSPAEDTVFLLLALWGFVSPKTHGNKSRYDFVLGILYGHRDWHCNYRFLHCLCFSKGTSQCSEALAEKICARFYYSA